MTEVVVEVVEPLGQRLGEGELPDELRGLNWGAVLMAFYWALFHGLWRWFLSFAAVYLVASWLSSPSGPLGSWPALSWTAWGVGRVAGLLLAAALGYRANQIIWEREARRVARESDQSVPRPAIPVTQYVKNQRTWAWCGLAAFVYVLGLAAWNATAQHAPMASSNVLAILSTPLLWAALFVYDRFVPRVRSRRS